MNSVAINREDTMRNSRSHFSRAIGVVGLSIAAVALLPTGVAAQQNGGFIERTTSGTVVDRGKPVSASPRRSTRSTSRKSPARPARAEPEVLPDEFYRIDEDAAAERPTADPVVITGKQGAGQVKPIVYVSMGDTSILQCVLSPGRLTQLNLYGEVAHIAFSDYERFRVGYKEGIFFISPGSKDSALVEWKRVRADLAVIMEDGRQYHFEFSVVPSDRPSHRVINVNAPPPLREPNSEELAEIERRRLAAEAEAKRQQSEAEAEAKRKRQDALDRAMAQPFAGKARKGSLEIAASRPVASDGRMYVKFAVTNHGKQPLGVSVQVGSGNASMYASEVLLATPLVGPKLTVGGLLIFDESAVQPGLPLVVSVSAAGTKPAEFRLDGGVAK